jgi:tRNA nucleotidyltransferase (CCA-adding enzyme)
MKNRLKKLPPQFRKVLKNSSALADSLGFKIYLVGGAVRDLLLNKKTFDLDIAVEGDAIILVKKLAALLKAQFRRHHSFGTATLYFDGYKIDASTNLSIDPERIYRVDFATTRTEKYPHQGALPRVSPASLAQDLFRRDFTINAMAISLNRADYGVLIDLYKGLEDLKKGWVRVLHPESFLDDPTRILRGIRFKQRFSFRFEPRTLKLIKEALSLQVLGFVSPHRLREEIILILKEPRPSAYIRQIKKLTGFSFLDKKLRLDPDSFHLFSRIEKASLCYTKKFKKLRRIQIWLLYLAAILLRLSASRVEKLLAVFGFRKGEQVIIRSINRGKVKVKRLDRPAKASEIYRLLQPYSFESILFFYAYYRRRNLRKNIEYFLGELSGIRLKISGRDLKKEGLKTETLYGRVLAKTLYSRMDKGLTGKREQLAEAKRIFKRQNKSV